MSDNQYHHYIPRFILKNFSIDKYERTFECYPVNKVKGKKKNPKKKYTKIYINHSTYAKIFPEYIKLYSLQSKKLYTSMIKRCYGVTNLYKDITNTNDVMYIEKRLSYLESISSTIINNIKNCYKNSKLSRVVITRKDLLTLKKFLFIMQYRKDKRKEQYINSRFTIGTYILMIKYMNIHKFDHPKDVWLNNIKQIIDTDNMKIMKMNINYLKHMYLDSRSKENSYDKMLNDKIFPLISNDYFAHFYTFLCIWEVLSVPPFGRKSQKRRN